MSENSPNPVALPTGTYDQFKQKNFWSILRPKKTNATITQADLTKVYFQQSGQLCKACLRDDKNFLKRC
jgi:hypothetical protein